MAVKNWIQNMLISSVLLGSAALGFSASGQASVYYQKGQEYFKKGEWANAIQEWNKAVEADPNFESSYEAFNDFRNPHFYEYRDQ